MLVTTKSFVLIKCLKMYSHLTIHPIVIHLFVIVYMHLKL